MSNTRNRTAIRLSLALFTVALMAAPAFAQQRWIHLYNGSSNLDWGYSVQPTFDGGYITVGQTSAFGDTLNGDVCLIKTDAAGDSTWMRTYGGVGSDIGLDVQQTRDSGYIIVGTTQSFGDTSCRHIYLIKTDATGNPFWTRVFHPDTCNELGNSVRQTADGGYIIAGADDYGLGIDAYDVYLIKTDASGDTVWSRTYGGPYNGDFANSVRITPDGGMSSQEQRHRHLVTAWTMST